MRFKVGDKVKIKEDLIHNKRYNGFIFDKYDMGEYCGKESTITCTGNIRNVYFLDIDKNTYVWSEDMLEPIDEKEDVVNYSSSYVIKEIDKLIKNMILSDVKKETKILNEKIQQIKATTNNLVEENQIKGEDKMSNKDFITGDMEYIIKDRKTGETLCKGKTASVDNIPKNNDIQQQFYKGDKIEILEEPFVGVQGEIVDEVKLMNKFLVKIGDINSLYIGKDKVKLVKKKLVITKKEFLKVMFTGEKVRVTIRGKRTTVRLGNGTQASVYCHENDEYNEELAIKLAYNKARRKDLDKEYDELLDRVESKEIKIKQDNIIGKKANVYRYGDLIATGIINKSRSSSKVEPYEVTYTYRYNTHCAYCAFDKLNEDNDGIIVTLAE